MAFNISMCIKVALCLALIIQLAKDNHHKDANQIAILLTATTTILLLGRFFKQRKSHKLGLHSAYPVLIPLAIYAVCSYFIESLGGLGGFAI